jgi:hypothetical protein
MEEHTYSGVGCWSWLGCYSFWFRYFTRALLELWKLPCNGQEYPDHWAINLKHLHHPLEVGIRNNILYTRE